MLTRPGLFITGTDTGVGKTAITCAIAAALRGQQPGWHVGVSKPFASGCRHDREGLVSEDAEALAHFGNTRLPLATINPIRFAAPLAPAVAAEQAGAPMDWALLGESLQTLDAACDALLIEGVGGLMVPLDPAQPKVTVLDFAAALQYPVVVVARSVLGTLNHSAMTVRLLKSAGLRVAGIIMNSYDADAAASDDPSVATNRVWMEKLTGVSVLAVTPRVAASELVPHKGLIPQDILHPIAQVHWPDVIATPAER